MSEAIQNMNSTFWVFAVMLIGLVSAQAIMFVRLALNFNKKNDLMTKDEISQAAKAGTISVFGPALSTIVVALSFIGMFGPAATFMRCGVVGSPSWELMMANTSVEAIGVAFGSPEFTPNVFVLCLFGMTWSSAPYFINTILTLKPLDMAVKKAQTSTGADGKKKESFIPHLGNAAIMGIMGNSLVGTISKPTTLVAYLVAAVVTFGIQKLSQKPQFKWMGIWNMGFAIVIGATAAYFVSIM